MIQNEHIMLVLYHYRFKDNIIICLLNDQTFRNRNNTILDGNYYPESYFAGRTSGQANHTVGTDVNIYACTTWHSTQIMNNSPNV